VSFNDSGATPSVSYGYDEYGARTSMTDGTGSTSYTYNTYHQLASEPRTITGLSGTYKLDYICNLVDELR
jgi:YD repeat-containing protein